MPNSTLRRCLQEGCGEMFRADAASCPRCGARVESAPMHELEYTSNRLGHRHSRRELEIDTAAGRRWASTAAYLLLFLLVASTLVTLFFKFTGSLRLALALVTFMITYMLIMGWLAARNPDRRE